MMEFSAAAASAGQPGVVQGAGCAVADADAATVEFVSPAALAPRSDRPDPAATPPAWEISPLAL